MWQTKELMCCGGGAANRSRNDSEVTEAHPPSMGTAVKAINLEHTIQPVVGSGVLSASLGPHCVVEGLLPRMAFPAVSCPIGPSATLIAFPRSPTVWIEILKAKPMLVLVADSGVSGDRTAGHAILPRTVRSVAGRFIFCWCEQIILPPGNWPDHFSWKMHSLSCTEERGWGGYLPQTENKISVFCTSLFGGWLWIHRCPVVAFSNQKEIRKGINLKFQRFLQEVCLF